MKLVKDTIESYVNESILNASTTPIFRVRMVGDIEFTKDELEEYMAINGLDPSDLKKGATGVAKVKWRNKIKKALESSDTKDIDEKNFKWNIK